MEEIRVLKEYRLLLDSIPDRISRKKGAVKPMGKDQFKVFKEVDLIAFLGISSSTYYRYKKNSSWPLYLVEKVLDYLKEWPEKNVK